MQWIDRMLKQAAASQAPRTKQDFVDFWVANDLQDIIPPGTKQPAGWDEIAFLRRVAGLLHYDTVVEFGCGYGRLCEAFAPAAYVGTDINPKAVALAGTRHPEYTFQVTGFDRAPLPRADLCLAYTVLLHVADDYIGETAERLSRAADKILIAEILGRRWRKGKPRVPVFNRERDEYLALFPEYDLEIEVRRPYRRYPDTCITFLYLVRREPFSGGA
jgi:SAM-dependent methyltransferase